MLDRGEATAGLDTRMKLLVALTFALTFLVGVAVYDMGEARKAREQARAHCRAPTIEGEVTLITVDVRSGALHVDCHYASTRLSKPRKGT